jgi:uncharacterized protein (DUF1330 family)
MHSAMYLVTGHPSIGKLALDPRHVVARGDAMVFEGPWPWASPVVARLDDAAIAAARASGIDGYLVDALGEPGAGEAFVVAAHRMRDLVAFQPYAEQVGAIVEKFGGRFLARSGKAEMLGGDFVSDRAVILEFPRAADAVAFYISDIYAPLMKIRHAASDPRFLVMARAGALPAAARTAAESYLRAQAASSH